MSYNALNSLAVTSPPPKVSGEIAAPMTFQLAPPMRMAAWLLGALLAFWLCLQWGASTSVHNDFTQNVWLPSRLVLDGANPYVASHTQVDVALGAYSAQFDVFNSGPSYLFIYPLWLALAMLPLGAMPLALATAIWRAANLLLLVWGVGSVLRSSSLSFRAMRPASIAALALTVFLCFVYRESILTLYIGQFAIIEFGLLAALWGWLVKSNGLTIRQCLAGDALAGLALAVLATKPQAVGLPVLLIGVWALSRRRFAIPVSAAISLASLLLLPTLFYPNSLNDWLSVVSSGQASSQAQVSASVWGLSYQWLGAQSPWMLISIALTLLGVAALLPRWWRDLKDRTSPVPLSLPLTLCMNSVISPYMLGYEHVLLLFPALVLLAAAGLPNEPQPTSHAHSRKRWRMALYLWLAALPMLVVAVQAVLNKEYPAIAQSLPMLAICWLARLEWKEGDVN